jgi:ERCC4-related helicase
MSAIVQSLKGVTAKYTSDSSNLAVANSGMKISQSALKSVQHDGRLGRSNVAKVVLLGKDVPDQKGRQRLLQGLNKAVAQANEYVRLEPLVSQALEKIEKGDKARLKMLAKAGKVGGQMAVNNAEAQTSMNQLHQANQDRITVAQASYSYGGIL